MLIPHARLTPNAALWALLLFCILAMGHTSAAWAVDDDENSTPTAWWIYSGQTYQEIWNTINTQHARIIDIKADSTFDHYTVTYVRNAGAYQKTWWFYVDIDAAELSVHLANTGARLISLQAYDIGGGNIRFAVAMIANTGADAKAWWYYYGQPLGDILSKAEANNARLTTLESYTSNGQTYYAFIMIANNGADAKAWWVYADVSAATVSNLITTKKARVLDLTPAATGLNVVLESCAGGCPSWWWYYGLSPSATLAKSHDDGARVLTAYPYPGCGSNCLASVMISNTPSDVTDCDPSGCISESKLINNICNYLKSEVVGYVCLVGQMRPVFGGLAQTSTDSPPNGLPMTPDLTINVASVSKTMTAIAIVQLLTENGLKLDTPIAPYLYSDWQQGPNIGLITFRHLLTHESGFYQKNASACENGFDYSSVKAIVAAGVNKSDIGNSQYGNCNFSLLRELMPALLGERLMNYPDGSQRAQQSSALYVSHVNSAVFEPVGVTDASCTPTGGPTGMLSYPASPGTIRGDDLGDWSQSCGAAGWQLSAFDLFKVLGNLANGSTLLMPSEKQQMFSGCLGWDCGPVGAPCPSPYVCKNGWLPGNNGAEVHTYAGVLKCNVPVAVILNSPLPSPWETTWYNIIAMVQAAYDNSSVPGVGPVCP